MKLYLSNLKYIFDACSRLLIVMYNDGFVSFITMHPFIYLFWPEFYNKSKHMWACININIVLHLGHTLGLEFVLWLKHKSVCLFSLSLSCIPGLTHFKLNQIFRFQSFLGSSISYGFRTIWSHFRFMEVW